MYTPRHYISDKGLDPCIFDSEIFWTLLIFFLLCSSRREPVFRFFSKPRDSASESLISGPYFMTVARDSLDGQAFRPRLSF